MNARLHMPKTHWAKPITHPGSREASGCCIAHWRIQKDDVPMVLTVAEEHVMSLSLRIYNDAGGHEVHSDTFGVRNDDGQLIVYGNNWSTSLDMEAIQEVRAELRYEQGCTQAAMECFDCEKRCLLSVAGPSPDGGSAGQVWCTLLSTLANLDGSAPESESNGIP